MDENKPKSKINGCKASLGLGLSNITVRIYKEEIGRDTGAPLNYNIEDELGLINKGNI